MGSITVIIQASGLHVVSILFCDQAAVRPHVSAGQPDVLALSHKLADKLRSIPVCLSSIAMAKYQRLWLLSISARGSCRVWQHLCHIYFHFHKHVNLGHGFVTKHNLSRTHASCHPFSCVKSAQQADQSLLQQHTTSWPYTKGMSRELEIAFSCSNVFGAVMCTKPSAVVL